ncbi:putative ribonuclease H protein [Glycine soja]
MTILMKANRIILSPVREINVHWNPLASNSVKLNTDGRSLWNPNIDGFGGLLRDSLGQWISCYSGSCGIATCLFTELIVLYHGVNLAWNKEESSKMFVHFLYNLHLFFHLKVSEISFSNLRLFSHADDPLLPETPSELVEHRLCVGVGGYVEMHSPVRGAIIVVHHAREVLASAEGLGHALHR